jgi:hypothetical protein
MSFLAIGIGLGTTALSIGANFAASSSAPKAPDAAASSAALAAQNAHLLPLQRGLQAAQQTGGDFSYTLPKGNDILEFKKAFPSATWSGRTMTWSFKDIGQAQVEAKVATQQAANQLALSQKFDSQFLESALEQEKLADPQGFAARERMSEMVQDQINRPVNSPVSDMLDSQVKESLDAAGQNKLTALDTERLNAAVASAQADRGGSSTPGDFAQPLTSGFAGEARQQAATAAARNFLASGSAPEDIAYRREQQNLANLSAEVNGKTPQSQFANLSGAQSGATPVKTAAPLAVMPEGQDGAAQSAAMANWNTTMRSQQAQVNPWMQGLSSLVNLGSVAGGMGWKPLGTS